MQIPKKKLSLHEQVVNELGQQIIAGRYVPGTTLPTTEELSLALGVSRTVAREAIKILEDKGLLRVRPKTGICVQPSSQWKMLDIDVMLWHYQSEESAQFLFHIIEVRRIVEPSAARLAAKHGTHDEFERIAQAYRTMQRSKRSLETYEAAQRDFHQAVYQATHNPLLIHMAETISLDMGVGRLVAALMKHDGKDTIILYKDILEAIHSRNAVKAYTVTLLLVNQIATYLAAALSLSRPKNRRKTNNF